MMTLFQNIAELVTLQGAVEKRGRNITNQDLTIYDNGALVVDGGRVVWAGHKKSAAKFLGRKNVKRVDLGGATVLPGLIDCHTHLVFAGNRSHEFELRNQGLSYQEIAASGGGIHSTVRATQKAKLKELQDLGRERMNRLLAQGVTAVEIKSGYGLNLETEIKILKAAQSLDGPQQVVTTFLGPHAIPPGKSEAQYVEECIQWLETIKKKKLSKRVDIFVEKGFFSAEQGEKFLIAAQKLGFSGNSVHLDQLTRSGEVARFLDHGVRSVDHCVHVNEEDIRALAASDVTSVLLPISDLYLRINYPPARKMLDQGVRVALATDYNPGTSPSLDFSLLGVLGRLQMKMQAAEIVCALTLNSAFVLGLENEIGSLTVGKRADFVAFNGRLNELFYEVGHHPVQSVWIRGQRKYLKKT